MAAGSASSSPRCRQPKREIELKLCSTSDMELQYIKALVYGDTGIGKTTSLRTLPEDRTLIALGERGAIPLRNKQFKVLRFGSWEDVRQIVGLFMSGVSSDKTDMLKALVETKVLVFDSLSEVSELCMQHILKVDRCALVSERTGSKRDTPANVYAELMGMEDWGLYRQRMRNFLATLAHLPVHVICTCQSAWSKDKTGGDTLRTPNLSGKLARECGSFFGLLLHMEAQQGEGGPMRVWRTFNSNDIMAKDESGALAPFEETDWTKLFTKILGTTKGKS